MGWTTTPRTPLQAARVAKGLSQRQVAARAGITAVALSHLETGKTSPRYTNARALSAVLDTPVEELFPPDEAEAQMEWYEGTGQVDAFYAKQDPRTWTPIVFEHEGRRFVEEPPDWFAKRVAAAKRPSKAPRTASRPRQKRSGSPKSTRGSPDDDPGPARPSRGAKS